MSKVKKIQKEIEQKSPEGFVIKIRPQRNSYLVFKPDGNPERLNPQDPNRILNPIRTIVFIGEKFINEHPYVDMCFVPVKRNRIIIPYRHTQLREIKAIQVHTATASDLVPMIIEKIDNMQLLFELLKSGKRVHYLVIEESSGREEIIRIKQRMPKVYIFQIRIQPEKEKPADLTEETEESGEIAETEETEGNDVRAADLVQPSEKNLELYSDNPVFLARIFLRNIELAKVKSLLLEKTITLDDNAFIQTMLDIMIRNDGKKKELERHKNELMLLKSFCQTQRLILEKNLDGLREVCEKEENKEKINFCNYLIKKYKDSATNKDEEILFWELGMMLEKKLSEMPSESGRKKGA